MFRPFHGEFAQSEDVAAVVPECGLVRLGGQRGAGELGVLHERPVRRQRQDVAEGESVGRLGHAEVHQVRDRRVEPVGAGVYEPAAEVLQQTRTRRRQLGKRP